MKRRSFFAALASLPFMGRLAKAKAKSTAAPLEFQEYGGPTGCRVNGQWFPSLDFYMQTHDGVLENSRIQVYDGRGITVPFKRLVGNYIEFVSPRL